MNNENPATSAATRSDGPTLYSQAHFEEERSLGTPAQQAAADALIRARNATRASARRHQQAYDRADTLAKLAAQAETERNEALAEHKANLDAQAEAERQARETQPAEQATTANGAVPPHEHPKEEHAAAA